MKRTIVGSQWKSDERINIRRLKNYCRAAENSLFHSLLNIVCEALVLAK